MTHLDLSENHVIGTAGTESLPGVLGQYTMDHLDLRYWGREDSRVVTSETGYDIL
jgi:hypothetical protein